MVNCLPGDDRNSRKLNALINRTGFDVILKAIETEGRPTTAANGRQIFEKPAFVIKVGNSIFRCAQFKRGQALRDGDTCGLQEADDFISLYKHEFTDRMASAAHASYRLKGNSLSEFPDEADLKLLRDYQNTKLPELMTALKDNPDEFVWRELAEITLSRVLVFNARRGSEAAELTVHDYRNATNRVDPALACNLTTVEKQLIQRLTVVNVTGKRDRPVPILLTRDMNNALTALCESRSRCGIVEGNMFVFALPQSRKGHLNFFGTLRRVAARAKLVKPHLLTTTRLRKHLATMAQVFLLFCCFYIRVISYL